MAESKPPKSWDAMTPDEKRERNERERAEFHRRIEQNRRDLDNEHWEG